MPVVAANAPCEKSGARGANPFQKAKERGLRPLRSDSEAWAVVMKHRNLENELVSRCRRAKTKLDTGDIRQEARLKMFECAQRWGEEDGTYPAYVHSSFLDLIDRLVKTDPSGNPMTGDIRKLKRYAEWRAEHPGLGPREYASQKKISVETAKVYERNAAFAKPVRKKRNDLLYAGEDASDAPRIEFLPYAVRKKLFETPEAEAAEKELEERVGMLVSSIQNETNRNVCRMLFGIGAQQQKLKEIAEEMGVSGARISQRKEEILNLLRGAAKEKGIRLSDYFE